MTAASLLALGIRIKCRLIRPESGWLWPSLTEVARHAVGVAVMRKNRR